MYAQSALAMIVGLQNVSLLPVWQFLDVWTSRRSAQVLLTYRSIDIPNFREGLVKDPTSSFKYSTRLPHPPVLRRALVRQFPTQFGLLIRKQKDM